eukprot:g1644.t1
MVFSLVLFFLFQGTPHSQLCILRSTRQAGDMATDEEWAAVFGPEVRPGPGRPRSNSDPSSSAGAKRSHGEDSRTLSGEGASKGALRDRALTTDDINDEKKQTASDPGSTRARTGNSSTPRCTVVDRSIHGAFGWEERRALQALDEDGHKCVQQLRDALAQLCGSLGKVPVAHPLGTAEIDYPPAQTSFHELFDDVADRSPSALRAAATLLVVASSAEEIRWILPAIIPTHLHDFGKGTQQFLQHCFHELECGQRYGEMSLVANATLDPLLDLLLRIVDDKKHSDGHVQMDSKIDNGSAAVETLDQAVYGPADSDEATKSAGDPDQSVTDPEILRLHASKRVVDLFTFLILGHQHSPWLLIDKQDSLVQLVQSLSRPRQWSFKMLPSNFLIDPEEDVPQTETKRDSSSSNDSTASKAASKLQKFFAKTKSMHLSSKKTKVRFDEETKQCVPIETKKKAKKHPVWGPDKNVHSLIDMGFSTEQSRYACWKMVQRTSVKASDVAAKAVAWLFDMDEFERDALNTKFHSEVMPLQMKDSDNDEEEGDRADASAGTSADSVNSAKLAPYGNVKQTVDDLIEYFVDHDKLFTATQIEHAIYTNEPGSDKQKLSPFFSDDGKPFSIRLMLKIGLKKLSGKRCPTLSLPNDRNDIEFSHELAAISYGVLVTPQFGIGITSDGF